MMANHTVCRDCKVSRSAQMTKGFAYQIDNERLSNVSILIRRKRNKVVQIGSAERFCLS